MARFQSLAKSFNLNQTSLGVYTRIAPKSILPFQCRLFADDTKSDVKQRPEPDMGTTFQEGSEGQAQGVKEAGFDRAREQGEKLTEAPGVSGKVSAAGDTAGDVASGVKQYASKVADMTKEAAGRAAETAKGVTGAGSG